MKYEALYLNSFLSHATFAECLDPCELKVSYVPNSGTKCTHADLER